MATFAPTPIAVGLPPLTETTAKGLASKKFVESLKRNQPPNADTDACFKVGRTAYFHAHREVLARSSIVFLAMFFGCFELERNAHQVIEIVDIRPQIFRILLKIIYNGVQKSVLGMRMEVLLETLYGVRKYILQQEKEFLTVMQRNLNPENALLVLETASFYNLSIIVSASWSLIERHTKRAVETDHFTYISWDTLHLVLENNRLTISEFDLFRGVCRWVEEARTVNPKQTAAQVLGVAVYKLRFPLMTKAEFEIVKLSHLLLEGEIKDLTSKFLKNATYSHKPRSNVCECRKRKKECILCTGCLGSSTDGRSITKFAPGRIMLARKLFQYLLLNFPNYRFTQGLVPITEVSLYNCECIKYNSCPAFPNGQTARLLLSISNPKTDYRPVGFPDLDFELTSNSLFKIMQMLHYLDFKKITVSRMRIY